MWCTEQTPAAEASEEKLPDLSPRHLQTVGSPSNGSCSSRINLPSTTPDPALPGSKSQTSQWKKTHTRTAERTEPTSGRCDSKAQTSKLKRRRTLADKCTEPATWTPTPAVATSHYRLGQLPASTNEKRVRDDDHHQILHEPRTRQVKRKRTQPCGSRHNAQKSSRTE